MKMISGEQSIKLNSNSLPWDLKGLNGRIYQRGAGGYYLCKECNSNTGSWYISEYVKLIRLVQDFLDGSEIDLQKAESIELSCSNIRGLAVFKAIMTMFCDINIDCFGDDSLRRYLLNKEDIKFDTKKYRVFIYYTRPDGLFRLNGYSVIKTAGGIFGISEISSRPLGFALYIDLPINISPPGSEITWLSSQQYSALINLKMNVPVLDVYSPISGLYQTKDEIIQAIYKDREQKGM